MTRKARTVFIIFLLFGINILWWAPFLTDAMRNGLGWIGMGSVGVAMGIWAAHGSPS